MKLVIYRQKPLLGTKLHGYEREDFTAVKTSVLIWLVTPCGFVGTVSEEHVASNVRVEVAML